MTWVRMLRNFVERMSSYFDSSCDDMAGRVPTLFTTKISSLFQESSAKQKQATQDICSRLLLMP
jgi:hypothetical protein